MINNSTEFPYFRLTNNGPATFAFDVYYISQGSESYAYSRPILPGNSVTATLDYDSTNIKFTVYVLNPPYQLIPIYRTSFNNAIKRCYLSSGTINNPALLRVPCFGDTPNNCCCCCCCCCK